MSSVDPFALVPPPIVYHYTSHDVVLKIMDKPKLWATNILYLNDATEFKLAVELFRKAVSWRKEKLRSDWRHQVLVILEERWLKQIFENSRIFVFTCSFSERGDWLSQWRGYTPTGAGYSIGFAGGALQEIARQQHFLLGKCVYDESQQASTIEQVLDRGLSLHADPRWLERPKPFGFIPQIAHDMFVQFVLTAPLLKHSAFEEEREWRLVGSSVAVEFPKPSLRAGTSMLIPYVELDFGTVQGMPIEHIMVGPTRYEDLARSSMELLVHSKGIRDSRGNLVPVENSQVPFRTL